VRLFAFALVPLVGFLAFLVVAVGRFSVCIHLCGPQCSRKRGLSLSTIDYGADCQSGGSLWSRQLKHEMNVLRGRWREDLANEIDVVDPQQFDPDS
jgi:hypothetical protein